MSDRPKTNTLTVILATLAVIVIVGGVVIGRVLFEPFWIPSGAMKPTLLVGDYITVRRFEGKEPARGDVVVFRDAGTNTSFVFRIIGLPGETVQMVGGKVVIDGAVLAQEALGPFEEVFQRQGPIGALPACANMAAIGEVCRKERFAETLPEGRQIEVLDIRASRLDDTPEVEIPEDHFFVLGDNRDNAVDSRVWPPGGRGFVHKDQITSRVAHVIFSSRGQLWNVFRWRGDRFFQEVQ